MRKKIKKSNMKKVYLQKNIIIPKPKRERQKLAIQILEILNQSKDNINTIRNILLLIKKFTNIEAVGIRLKEGKDYPYYETNGFPIKFTKSEKYLCAYNNNKELKRDSKGNPVLECMCGKVIIGKINLNKAYFTKSGSFWVNSTTDYYNSIQKKDLPLYLRNRCGKEGYESLALIPLCSDKETIGLLQLNDKRKNKFTQEMIEFFEGIGASIGISLTRNVIKNALKRSEERYALAQRAANIGSWDWDIKTNDLQWSDTIEPMFGFKKVKFGATFQAFLECIHPEDQQFVLNSVDACVKKRKEYDIEHRIVWPNGIIRWVSETGDVIRDKTNKAIRMLGIVQDITERKAAEEIIKRDKDTLEKLVNKRTEELLKTQKKLDQAKRLSDIGILAATVAHELRNPLGVIGIAAYNIKRKRQNILLDKHIENIEKKISESSQIINNLLNYSHIKMPDYKKIQIHDILNECISSAKKRFKEKKVSINKKLQSFKQKYIEADALQIKEVFNNILNNAFQSILNKKGKIEINIGQKSKNIFKIAFKDNGIGIDREDLKKLFEPFFTRKSKGTGLGLAICKEIINRHNGKINITSVKNQGTTVSVSLPIKGKT